MSLLQKYDEMKKEAEATQKQTEKMDYLEKVASVAEEMLTERFGEDYEADDVEKLALNLINMEMERVEDEEKIANLDEAGRIMAKSFIDEISKSK